MYMAQLRRKLEADPSHPKHFVTEPGMGYRFEKQGPRHRASRLSGRPGTL
ncbi:winged helix-turn-helix domain-containing protein [Streptomyces sp. NPDC019990]